MPVCSGFQPATLAQRGEHLLLHLRQRLRAVDAHEALRRKRSALGIALRHPLEKGLRLGLEAVGRARGSEPLCTSTGTSNHTVASGSRIKFRVLGKPSLRQMLQNQ